MLYIFLSFLLFTARAAELACNPAVELCRVHPQSGQLTPVPMSQGGSLDGTGSRVTDVCGVVGGDGTSCLGCDNKAYPNGGKPTLDACGVCGGDGTTCCGLGLCSNNGMCVDAQCQCKRGWTGSLCESPAVLCADVYCGEDEGHGQCNGQTGMCNCAEGWTGASCQMRNCLPNGAFDSANAQCVCLPGWSGDHCDMCATAPKGSTYVCTAPFHLLALKKVDAAIKLRHHLVWAPDSTHDGIYYDCSCAPRQTFENEDGSRSLVRENNMAARDAIGARSLNVVQLEEAFNELSRIAISRFASTQSDLDKAVAETQDYCDNQFGDGVRGVFLGIGVVMFTMIGTFIVVAFALSRTFSVKNKKI